jgi:hypothetical protein
MSRGGENLNASAESEYRYEIKFAHASFFGSHLLIEAIKQHPAIFREIYAGRRVNNIYFDTVDYLTVNDNVSGYADREKIRIRWYGKSLGKIRPVLELKRKVGSVGTKTKYELKSAFRKNTQTIEDLLRPCLQGLSKPADEILSCVRPTLMNTYDRRYFVSACGGYRITLDENVNFYSVGRGMISRVPSAELDSTHILEVKYPIHNQKQIYGITKFLPFRLTKSSKYVAGIDLLSRQGLS